MITSLKLGTDCDGNEYWVFPQDPEKLFAKVVN
jgi:hypothetical protein